MVKATKYVVLAFFFLQEVYRHFINSKKVFLLMHVNFWNICLFDKYWQLIHQIKLICNKDSKYCESTTKGKRKYQTWWHLLAKFMARDSYCFSNGAGEGAGAQLGTRLRFSTQKKFWASAQILAPNRAQNLAGLKQGTSVGGAWKESLGLFKMHCRCVVQSPNKIKVP